VIGPHRTFFGAGAACKARASFTASQFAPFRLSPATPPRRYLPSAGRRWSSSPLGDLFLVCDHNLRELEDVDTGIRRWQRESTQLLATVAYTLRY